MVVAESPIAFSLRKAVAESVRHVPHKHTDALRKIWNQLRNSVRLGTRIDEDAAAAEVSVLSSMNTSTDWINVPGQFTSTFSVQSAAECIRMDMFRYQIGALVCVHPNGYVQVPNWCSSLCASEWICSGTKLVL